MSGSRRTTTRFWGWPRTHPPRRSARSTGSWPSSITLTRTPVRRSVSRRSQPPTTCSVTRRSARSTTRSAASELPETPSRAADAAGGQGFTGSFHVDDLGDLLGNIFGRGARAGRGGSSPSGGGRSAPPRGRSGNVAASVVSRRGQRAHHHRQPHLRGGVPHLRWQRVRSRHGSHGVPDLRGPRGHPGQPRPVLLQPAVPDVRRHRLPHRDPVPDMPRRWGGAGASSGEGSDTCGGRGRAEDPYQGPRGGRVAAVGRPETCTWWSTSPVTASSAGAART